MPPPWLIIVLVVVALLWLLVRSSRKRRLALGEEFAELLRRERPGVTVLSVDAATPATGPILKIRPPAGGESTMSLHKLNKAILESNAATDAARRPMLEHWLAIFDEAMAGETRTLRDSLDKLRPRILTAGGYPADVLDKLISRPLGETGLRVAYVLDSPNSVQYVTAEQAGEAGLDEAALHERALANLRPSVPEELVRGAVTERKMVLMKAGDTYDASRVLLVGEHLRPGEALLALIPDRDTLMIIEFPDDTTKLEELGRKVRADPNTRILDRPLRVTADGIALLG